MPYVAIKCYPKDEAARNKAVERINQVLMEEFGVPEKAVTISYEEISREDWPTAMADELSRMEDKMMIKSGEKRF